MFNDEFYDNPEDDELDDEAGEKPSFPPLPEDIDQYEDEGADYGHEGQEYEEENDEAYADEGVYINDEGDIVFYGDDDVAEEEEQPQIEQDRPGKRRRVDEQGKEVIESAKKDISKALDDYYDMDFEDLIAGGEIKARFKYRKVPANDFGLTAEEVGVVETSVC